MGERITAYCSSQAQPMAVGLAALVHCVRGPPGARARRDGLENNAFTHRATELGQVGELEEWRICYKVTNGHSNTKNIVTTNKFGRTSFLKRGGVHVDGSSPARAVLAPLTVALRSGGSP